MTRGEVIRFAREADCLGHFSAAQEEDWVDKLEKLSELIEQHVKNQTKLKLLDWVANHE